MAGASDPEPDADPDRDGVESAVTRANERFYAAFEAADLDAMSDLWLHDDTVFCTHPGWRTLHGWGAIAGSWVALFGNGQQLQFIVTNEHAVVAGDCDWVPCHEKHLGGGGSGVDGCGNVDAGNDSFLLGRFRFIGRRRDCSPRGAVCIKTTSAIIHR